MAGDFYDAFELQSARIGLVIVAHTGGAESFDDVTLLAVRRRPSRPEEGI